MQPDENTITTPAEYDTAMDAIMTAAEELDYMKGRLMRFAYQDGERENPSERNVTTRELGRLFAFVNLAADQLQGMDQDMRSMRRTLEQEIGHYVMAEDREPVTA